MTSILRPPQDAAAKVRQNMTSADPVLKVSWDNSGQNHSGSFSTISSIDISIKSSLSSSSATGTSSVKNSLSSGKSSDGTMSDRKSSEAKISESAKGSGRECEESQKTSSVSRASNSSAVSDSNESSCSSFSRRDNKPHKANDSRWEAIRSIRLRDGNLGLSHFRLLKRLGCGDIGSVYLAELRGSNSFFAMKVMDKGSLASRKKLLRAQTEREILQALDHPFLPTLYTHFETSKFSCLVMEFCTGGDLHTLRQRQPGKHFTEAAAR